MPAEHVPSATSATPQARIKVVAAVIERDGRFLLCRRPLDKRHGGLWEFPGGKIHQGESLEQAVVRELEEELAVSTTSVGELWYAVHDDGSDYEILFVPAAIEGEPTAIEHTEFAWCAPGELHAYSLAPSDRAFATHLLNARA